VKRAAITLAAITSVSRSRPKKKSASTSLSLKAARPL
jgi:hypothetical protein